MSRFRWGGWHPKIRCRAFFCRWKQGSWCQLTFLFWLCGTFSTLWYTCSSAIRTRTKKNHFQRTFNSTKKSKVPLNTPQHFCGWTLGWELRKKYWIVAYRSAPIRAAQKPNRLCNNTGPNLRRFWQSTLGGRNFVYAPQNQLLRLQGLFCHPTTQFWIISEFFIKIYFFEMFQKSWQKIQFARPCPLSVPHTTRKKYWNRYPKPPTKVSLPFKKAPNSQTSYNTGPVSGRANGIPPGTT